MLAAAHDADGVEMQQLGEATALGRVAPFEDRLSHVSVSCTRVRSVPAGRTSAARPMPVRSV